jgi:hypothetical protein
MSVCLKLNDLACKKNEARKKCEKQHLLSSDLSMYRLHKPGLTLARLLATSDMGVALFGLLYCIYQILLRYIFIRQSAMSTIKRVVFFCKNIFFLNLLEDPLRYAQT